MSLVAVLEHTRPLYRAKRNVAKMARHPFQLFAVKIYLTTESFKGGKSSPTPTMTLLFAGHVTFLFVEYSQHPRLLTPLPHLARRRTMTIRTVAVASWDSCRCLYAAPVSGTT